MKVLVFLVSLCLLLVLSESKQFRKRQADESAPVAPQENQGSENVSSEAVPPAEDGKSEMITDATDNASGMPENPTNSSEAAEATEVTSEAAGSMASEMSGSTSGAPEITEASSKPSSTARYTVMTKDEVKPITDVMVEASSVVQVSEKSTQPSSTTMQPKEPSKVTEEPSKATEEPSKVKEEPSKVTEEPSKVTEKPSTNKNNPEESGAISEPIAATSTKRDGGNTATSFVASLLLVVISVSLTSKYQ